MQYCTGHIFSTGVKLKSSIGSNQEQIWQTKVINRRLPGNKPQASRNLQIKLLQLLNGDRHTANRLIALAKARNPDKSIDWWVEKVIFDLQRDRGSY